MKALNKKERFICEMIWGGVPVDKVWVRESKLFEQGILIFDTGIWNSMFEWDRNILPKYIKNS